MLRKKEKEYGDWGKEAGPQSGQLKQSALILDKKEETKRKVGRVLRFII